MSSSASTQNAVPIEMKDMTGFKFVILNILGHDYMHDFLLSSNRTKKGSVIDGNKKVSLLKKSSKILRGIAKYYNKVDSNFMKKLMKGGGMFDNPDEMTDVDVASISDSKSDRTSTSDISVTPTNDISTIDSDISTFDKELYTIDELIDILPNQSSVSSAEGEKSGNSDEDNDLTEDSELIANIHEYFQDLSGVRKNADGEIIEFNPTIIKILAESMVTGILSPVISKMLDIGKRNHLKNRNMTYELLDSQYNSLFGIDYGEDDEDDEIDEDEEESSPSKSRSSHHTDIESAIDEIQQAFMQVTGTVNDSRKIGTKILTIPRKNLKEVTETSESINQGEIDDVLNKLITDEESIDGEELSISNLENNILTGTYGKGSYTRLIKNMLLKNYINIFNEDRTGSTKTQFTLFIVDKEDESIMFDMRPIENTVSELENLLKTKFLIDMNNNSTNSDDYNLLNKSADPIEEFKLLIQSNKIEINDGGQETPNLQLKHLFKNAMLQIHPDLSGRPDATAVSQIIISEYNRLRRGMVSRGGKIQKGGAIDTDKEFAMMNTILTKAIIENSLVLMDCVGGNKDLGYFPRVETDSTLETPFQISSYRGFRPIFKNVFSGKELQTQLTNEGFVDNINGNIDWIGIKDRGSIEMRKLIARRIMLNAQILILYQRCMPSGISTNSLFEGLLLKMDNKKRKNEIMEKRGYLTMTLSAAQNNPDFIQKFGVKNIEEAKKNILLRRRKFFGMLFDNIEGDTYSGLPKWLKHSNTEDDMLQNAFNVVLDALLPEFILEFGYQPKILEKEGRTIDVNMPTANTDGSNAYIINNAVPLSYPTPKKAHEERFGFLNLDGMQSRHAQFCPVTSIADSQPLCSIKTKASFKETAPRALNYTMEMGLEAPIKAGTYSYYVTMRKVNENPNDYNFYISGLLTGPGFSINIGNQSEQLDLKLGPLSAVNTYYKILKQITHLTKAQFADKSKRLDTRLILRDFFYKNMEYLMKSSVQKSIGDYGQEFTALSKFGATSIDIYNTQNKIGSTERTKTLPYNDTGNSLRVMIANDRPSAYRGIFISLFSNQSTINTRCIIGYYRSKIQDPSEESKNSLIMGQHVLSNDRKSIRTDEADTLVDKTQDDTTLVEEAKKTGKLRNVLKPSVRRSARQANSKPKWRTISMFFRRYPEFKTWSKERGIVIKPTNFRTRAREFSENFNENNSDAQREINFNPGGNLDWVMRGGKKNKPKKKKKRKTKKNKRRKNKTKKKSKNKKRKSIKKRNKKRRNTRKLK